MTISIHSEEQQIKSGRGKWSNPGVPHRGWRCVDIEDLGAPQAECRMCESQTIRYVHHMQHPNYSEVLGVGCVCAGHMEEDVAAARGREVSMRSRASKRKRWLSRKWKTSVKGNPWIIANGYRITIYRRDSGWATLIAQGDEPPMYSRRNFPAREQAQLAAFDHITKLLAGKA